LNRSKKGEKKTSMKKEGTKEKERGKMPDQAAAN